MAFEPDYAKCTLRELLDVSTHIDREKYPQRAVRVDYEIAMRRKREATGLSSCGGHPGDAKYYPKQGDGTADCAFSIGQSRNSELALEFKGLAKDYFRIWIVNLCLTLITFGVFSAWAKVRKKRFAYSHTTLDGTSFQYLAKPVPILKGRLVAGAGFLIYYISSHFFTSLVPWVLGCGMIVAPWVIVRSAAFNARYTAFRNITFQFRSGYIDASKAIYVWGLVPLFFIGLFLDWFSHPTLLIIASVVSVIFFPWWLCRLKRFLVNNTTFGGQKGILSATGGQFFGIYFVSGLILMAFTVPLGVFAYLAASADKIRLFSYVGPILVYTGYVFAYAYVKARSGNLVYNHTCLGPIRFQSTLRAMELLKLYVTNAIGIVLSLGLLIPWAVIRTWKYRADHTRVWLRDELTVFSGGDRSGVEAVGAEALDFFDVDISI